jgi:hypothetical protein
LPSRPAAEIVLAMASDEVLKEIATAVVLHAVKAVAVEKVDDLARAVAVEKVAAAVKVVGPVRVAVVVKAAEAAVSEALVLRQTRS